MESSGRTAGTANPATLNCHPSMDAKKSLISMQKDERESTIHADSG